MTFRELWQVLKSVRANVTGFAKQSPLFKIKRIYGGAPREIRYTAVGWQPGEDWTQDSNPPSGAPEFYRVVRKGEARSAKRLTEAERRQIELDLQREG